jgi:hypothetical protein
MRTLICGVLLVVCLLPAGAVGLQYLKLDDWRTTWDRSIEASTKAEISLGPWSYIGPFDSTGGAGFNTVYPPESELKFDAIYQGKGGNPVSWLKGDKFRDGEPNSLRIFEDNDNIAVYMHRTITVAADTELEASFGSDDGIKVWVNGKQVVSDNASRACLPDQDIATLPLHKGSNDLLIKVTQGGGPSGFYFSLGSTRALEQALLQRVMADFPDRALEIMVERDWYRQDGISLATDPLAKAVEKTLAGARRLLEDLRTDRSAAFLSTESTQLQALEALHAQLQTKAPDGTGPQWRDLYLRAHQLRRQIALQNPLLDFSQLLFVKHIPGKYSHMCDQNYGWHARPGGGIFVLDEPGKSLKLRDVIGGQLPEGSFMHPELSFDARHILFAYWKAKQETPEDKYYHIYEIGVDGTGLRQLTRGEYDDFNPCYLPDGDIVFVSTRRGGYGRCHGRPVPLYTLHRMHSDGSGIVRISHNEANEWDPAVLDDGRIVYSRWDYVDRHAVDYQSLWVCWPDGSEPLAVYGNATKNPMANYQPRQIPGTHSLVSTAAAHHSYTAGSLVAVDPWREFDGLSPLRRLTPEVPFVESEGWPSQYIYTTPWPLGENYYLTAFSFDKIEHEGRLNPPNQHGLYLVDSFGNRELLYRDLAISSISPLPLRPRPAPPVLMSRSEHEGYASEDGQLMLTDIYRSMEKVERGAIKSLRIIQLLPKQTPITNVPALGMASQENGKYVLGTVPVEPDGSACFRAPANKPLFFQALDDRGRAVHSMRTLTYLQPGQTLSCIGCHEDRNMAPPVSRPMAVRRGVSDITPGPEGSAPMSYPILVQPILDRNCASCHTGPEPKAGVDLSGTVTDHFTRSYETLMNRQGLVHRWFAYNTVAVTQPRTFGALASKLTTMLEQGHHGVRLSADEWNRLYTWIDANALFYGSFLPEQQKLQQQGERIAMPDLQ